MVPHVLACPAEVWFTHQNYARAYNFFERLDSEDAKVDAFVNHVDPELSLQTQAISVTAAEASGNVEYFARAFAHAARHVDEYDVYQHMHFGFRDFNPTLLAHLEGDTPVLIGPAEAGHDIPPEEFRTIVDRSLGVDLPDPMASAVYSVAERTVHDILNPIREGLFARTLQQADRIVAVHSGAADTYAEYVDRSKIDVIPYGVDFERFEFTERRDTADLLVVGNLIRRKGHRYLLDALPDIADAVPDAHLHIVGEGPEEDALREQAADLGVREHVTFHGRVPEDELASRFCEARVFVHPSLSEGFSHVRLEAMATGCPVVGTNVEGAHDLTRNGVDGHVVPTGDPSALAEATIDLLTNLEKAREMGRNAREKVEQDHDWADIAAQYADVYRELAE